MFTTLVRFKSEILKKIAKIKIFDAALSDTDWKKTHENCDTQ